MYPQHARDPQQRPDARVQRAGLDTLIGGPTDPGRQEDALLGAVLAKSFNADAVADGFAFSEEPGVVVGQVGHSLHAGATMITSQPGIPGIL